ncbi:MULTISPECIES: hypothetical protein [unclassified Avibacterium]|uniref:hypothetical protein n=1 Tax=unclassified Avibacterium TaxID=2685287 RepID=UPI002027412A|nr:MULTISPECIES: hypothetical protein [unclassified Avibacterium]MCW9718670.1 hypothetical protein [Avibacterium sp. 21-599]MCW9734053.1 hypothetical protein [Avibacterium sp. 20-15]URL03700.1 hypothetical protein L4F93_09015 [Avibacterium sp. 20-132]
MGKQTSLTMDNEKILLRFGKNTILMNEEGIWLDGVHIGMQEKELQVPDNTGEPKPDGEIIQLYWSYGEELIKLEDLSRHYTDLNLHIVKENGRVGDKVEAIIEYETENGKENVIVSGIIGNNSEAVIRNVFEKRNLSFNKE